MESQKPKRKVSPFRDILNIRYFALGLCFHFGRWYCLHAEFYGMNGTPILDSVVLKSGGLLRSEAGHVSSIETDTMRSFHLG